MSSIKRDVKKKAPPRPEDGDSFSRSSPLCFVYPEEVWLGVHSRKVSLLMVANPECERRGKQDYVNHGSIRGSWPIAISGYPRGHERVMCDSVPKHRGPISLTDTHPRTKHLQNPTAHHRRKPQRWKSLFLKRCSSCLTMQLMGVERHSFLPDG